MNKSTRKKIFYHLNSICTPGSVQKEKVINKPLKQKNALVAALWPFSLLSNVLFSNEVLILLPAARLKNSRMCPRLGDAFIF